MCKRNLHTHFAVQTASRLSDPPNPLPEPKGSAIDRDTVLLNGGFQPRIFMKVGYLGYFALHGMVHHARAISLLGWHRASSFASPRRWACLFGVEL